MQSRSPSQTPFQADSQRIVFPHTYITHTTCNIVRGGWLRLAASTYYVWVGCVCMCLIIYLSVAIRLKQFAFNPPPRARAYCLCPWLLALVLRVGHRGVPWPRLWRGLPALRRAGLRLRCPGGVSFGGTLPCSASPASEVCALRVVRPWPAIAVAWALVLAAGAKRWLLQGV